MRQMSPVSDFKFYRSFVISVGLTIAICLAGIFLGIAIRTQHLVSEEILTQARAHFSNILITRKWNARYGGVYVEKKKGVTSSPYLDDPDIKTIDGKVYTLRNPALMTREISEYAEKEGLFQFHITSLHPINPNNEPDEFERKALLQFQEGGKEIYEYEIRNSREYFRYMAPLFVGEECLKCHARQGYKVGDIRGGISVTFDIDDIQEKLQTNMSIILVLGVVVIVLLLGLISLFTIKLYNKLSEARRQIEILAITDDLTEIFNRRHLMSRFQEELKRAQRLKRNLGCILIDIDHFKSVNDEYGHLTGDEVLRKVAKSIKQSIRGYDILGRLGGEEFLVILPDTDFENTRFFAERIRAEMKVKFEKETVMAQKISVTVSLGITSLREEDEPVDDILKRADEGLYKAKNAGRNQVGWV